MFSKAGQGLSSVISPLDNTPSRVFSTHPPFISVRLESDNPQSMHSRIILEVCVDSVESALASVTSAILSFLCNNGLHWSLCCNTYLCPCSRGNVSVEPEEPCKAVRIVLKHAETYHTEAAQHQALDLLKLSRRLARNISRQWYELRISTDSPQNCYGNFKRQ